MDKAEKFSVPKYVQDHIYDYQLDEFRNVYKAKEIKGARVVEIGGDYHLVSSRLFAANGATSVVTTSLANSFSPEPLPEVVSCRPVDFSQLTLEPNSVDLIFGVAILEHIPDAEQIATAIDRLLAPGGVAYLHGCPLWAGPDGHHIWLYENQIKGSEGMPCDPSDPIYCFNNVQKNPIPDWAHCVNDPRELMALLVSTGKQKLHAEAIANFVYNLDGKSFGSSSNRKSSSELISQFNQYFDVKVGRVLAQNQENEYYAFARRRFSEADLKTVGLRLTLTKR